MEGPILVYSMGNSNEAHGPALPRDIDDRVGKRIARDVCIREGFTYAGHLPYATDSNGPVMKDISPAWMEPGKFLRAVTRDLRRDLKRRGKASGIILMSGHGGNNLLEEHEKELRRELGVPVLYVKPFEGVSLRVPRYGIIAVTHAHHGEHSVAAYLGMLKRDALDELNRVAGQSPEQASRRWRAIARFSGYVLYGGDRYEILRNPRNKRLQTARRFFRERHIMADPGLGKRLYDKNLERALRLARAFAKAIR